MLSVVLLFAGIGTPELMVILFAILLLFGGKKLPELARGLGKGIREFKDASEGVKREIHRNINSINDDLDMDLDSKPSSYAQNAPATPQTNQDNADLNSTPPASTQKDTEQSHINS